MWGFKKGQDVYAARTRFATEGDIVYMTVIKRTVDACGEKQMTFEDHGFDVIYGKKAHAEYSEEYFFTWAQSYEYLLKYELRIPDRQKRILYGQFTDRDDEVFKYLKKEREGING